MKVRLFLLATLSAIALASCNKDSEQIPQEICFSVLGDSYSAMEGYVDPEDNDCWGNYPVIGVTDPTQMWWYQVAEGTGWIMDKNNSFSGSLVCNMDVEHYYGAHSFIRRMDDLGTPDVIFVFGATNDVFNKVPLGECVYSDWTDEQLCTFRPGLAYLYDNLGKMYPQAKLFFLVDLDLCSGGVAVEIRDEFIDAIHEVSDHYHVKCIDLEKIHKKRWHPDPYGQKQIAKQVIKAVKPSVNA